MERCEPAARPQHLRCFRGSRDRVYPVPGCPGDDRVEGATGRVPGFERGYVHLEAAAPREIGHPGVGLDAEHLAAGRLELPSCDAGAAADVEDVRPRTGGDDPLNQGLGVTGPGPVVALRVYPERLRHLPVLMGLGLPRRRALRGYGGHVSTL